MKSRYLIIHFWLLLSICFLFQIQKLQKENIIKAENVDEPLKGKKKNSKDI